MRAAVHERYGTVAVRDVERPQPAAGEVLVRVHAASLNAADWYAFVGRPYVGRALMGFLKPRSAGLGADFAGVVEASGDGGAGSQWDPDHRQLAVRRHHARGSR